MRPPAPSAAAASWRRWRWVVLVSALAGFVYGARHEDALTGTVTGAVTGGLLSAVEIFGLGGVARRPTERLPFGLYFALRVLVYVAVIVGVDVAVSELFGGGALAGALARGDFGFAVTMSVGVNLLFSVNDLLGPGVLFAFAAGRYRRPRREERALLYLDLCGSTALAERLGEERFLDFLNAFFADVTEGVVAEGGEIHKYVGDEVIATWSAGADPARPIRATFAARRRLAERAEFYRSTFGATPSFRAAIHAGPVVIGELGARKMEIALIGDAMNTAARVLEAARETGAPVLISAGYFAQVEASPAGIRAASLPPIPLRGKTVPLALIRLDEEPARLVGG